MSIPRMMAAAVAAAVVAATVAAAAGDPLFDRLSGLQFRNPAGINIVRAADPAMTTQPIVSQAAWGDCSAAAAAARTINRWCASPFARGVVRRATAVAVATAAGTQVKRTLLADLDVRPS